VLARIAQSLIAVNKPEPKSPIPILMYCFPGIGHLTGSRSTDVCLVVSLVGQKEDCLLSLRSGYAREAECYGDAEGY
jgi:hypothetical protein